MRFTGLIRRPWAAPSQPSSKLGRWIEAILLIVLAFQVARLIWALLSSTAPYGDWNKREPMVPGAQTRAALFSAFDPFFRQAQAGGDVQQVTSLPLQLYGIRINEGSGLGSAIIADESGLQQSYSVGEEIAPGVKLTAVAYDHVTIERSGATEALYINQSNEAPAVAGAAPGPNAPPGPPPPGATPNTPPMVADQLAPDAILNGVSFVPRTERGEVTGIVLGAQGSSDAFARAGFRPGDIIGQINGTPVHGPEDIANLKSSIRPGARISVTVERGGQTIPIALIIPDKK